MRLWELIGTRSNVNLEHKLFRSYWFQHFFFFLLTTFSKSWCKKCFIMLTFLSNKIWLLSINLINKSKLQTSFSQCFSSRCRNNHFPCPCYCPLNPPDAVGDWDTRSQTLFHRSTCTLSSTSLTVSSSTKDKRISFIISEIYMRMFPEAHSKNL